ncbi:unnamed protein product [Discula destructiva]
MLGSSSTITAAAQAQDGVPSNWPGGTMRQAEVRVESRELDSLDAELRRRSRYVPRESRWTVAGDHEAIKELTAFLRNVTPPPSNFMSVPSPDSTTTGTLSAAPSIRRRKTRLKRGALMKVIGLLRRVSNKKGSVAARSPSRSKKRPVSPSLTRSPAIRRKRPPTIRLPDTAIAGRTVDGHRHIAISIPIEHANLGPQSRYGYPSPVLSGGRTTRSRSMSSADTASPRVYDDINYNVRPLTAFVAEPHIGTQLGPLVEERESLSSRSWERGSSNGSGHGGTEAAMARNKVRVASRHTFGTVHEESSRPTTASGRQSGAPAPQPSSPPTSDESTGKPATPRTSHERRVKSNRQALAALSGGSPSAGGSPSDRAGAHNLRPSSAPTPSKMYYPMRKSSLHPTGTAGAVAETRRPRTMSNTTGGTNYSRESSRDQTLHESIFSERSYLESLDTMESTGNLKDDLRNSPMVVSEATFARRFEGIDVVEFEPRSSSDSVRRKNRGSGSSRVSGSSRSKRTSGSSRASASASASASDKGKQRASYEGPVVVVKPHRLSGDSATAIETGPVVVVTAAAAESEKRRSGGSTRSASAIFGQQRKSEPAPVVVTKELAAAAEVVAASGEKKKTGGGPVQSEAPPETPPSTRRSRFFEDLDEVSPPRPKTKKAASTEEVAGGSKAESQVREDNNQGASSGSRLSSDIKGKGKEIQEVAEVEPPSIELQLATPPKPPPEQSFDKVTSRKQRTSKARRSETVVEEAAEGAVDVSSPPREKLSKGKQREISPVRPVEEMKRSSTPDRRSTESTEAKDNNTSPLPSPKDRRERRKSVLLSRKQRVAVLRAALDKPGSQPRDLVLERRLSGASISSSESTTPKPALKNRSRDSFPYAPATLAPITPSASKPLTFARILTVADVRPSSPEFDLVRKDSTAHSVSSPATNTTLTKTSPITPYRSIGSVTPPESPTEYAPVDSPSSQFSTVEAHGTTLRPRPSTPVMAGRIARRRSGRTSPSSFSGRRSPGNFPRESSPPRPKTAGKGALASNKPFFDGRRSVSPHSGLDQDDHVVAGPSAARGKSILVMSRSEIFDRYESLREKHTRDLERRIRRLERSGDYWLKSMLPILSDMSQTLKIAVGNNKGKEVAADDRPQSRHDGRRRSRFEDDSPNVVVHSTSSGRRIRLDEAADIRSTTTLDSDDDEMIRHGVPASQGRRDITSRRPRLYLHDDAMVGPSHQGHGSDRLSPLSRDGHFSMKNIERLRSHNGSRGTSLVAESQQYHQPSGSTTVVDSATTARGNSFVGPPPRPSSKRASAATSPMLREGSVIGEAERIARLEKMTERIDAEIRRFPLVVPRTPPPPPPPPPSHKSAAARDRLDSISSSNSSSSGGGGGGRGRRVWLPSESSEESLRTYQGTEADRSTIDLSTMEEHWSRQRGGQGQGQGQGQEQTRRSIQSRRRRDSDSSNNSNMDTLEPLMRELQVVSSRVSCETTASEELGDEEVRRLRQPPGPRAVVGFGAFSM